MRTLSLLILFGALGSSSAALAAAGSGGGVDVSSLLRLIIGLVVVIAAVVALAWFLRRFSGITQNADGQLRVLGGLAVGQRERIVLVQVGEEQLLVGVAPGRVQTLHVLEQPLAGLQDGVATRSQMTSGSFAERLRHAMQQQDGKR